jgi:hypothetical protein
MTNKYHRVGSTWFHEDYYNIHTNTENEQRKHHRKHIPVLRTTTTDTDAIGEQH